MGLWLFRWYVCAPISLPTLLTLERVWVCFFSFFFETKMSGYARDPNFKRYINEELFGGVRTDQSITFADDQVVQYDGTTKELTGGIKIDKDAATGAGYVLVYDAGTGKYVPTAQEISTVGAVANQVLTYDAGSGVFVPGQKIATTAASTGQALVYDGTNFVPSANVAGVTADGTYILAGGTATNPQINYNSAVYRPLALASSTGGSSTVPVRFEGLVVTSPFANITIYWQVWIYGGTDKSLCHVWSEPISYDISPASYAGGANERLEINNGAELTFLPNPTHTLGLNHTWQGDSGANANPCTIEFVPGAVGPTMKIAPGYGTTHNGSAGNFHSLNFSYKFI